ncbi:SH3 domain-containing protein [Apibacter muscae]|uniref:SH3 domain-containing protein n=1 Tax=Apibacter muscae TaxID=2509004 RepID=A0A563D934_9FLAO|nr:SH3 domain-containing protein [Apibacter muscae]TWP26798.1 SH3 domain-containing protein [Apibacter muscae]
MKKLILILLINLLITCKAQKKEYTINSLEMEVQTQAKFLASKGYKVPSEENFKKYCKDYFNLDLESIKEEYFQPIGEDGYGLSVKQKFINTFPESIFYNPNTSDDNYNINQAFENLNKKENLSSEKFVSYNKLLFNNDSLVVHYFIKKTDDLKEIVLFFDYEKNDILYNILLRDLNLKNTLGIEDTYHILFYNNPTKGFKRKLITDLVINQGINALKKLTDSYYNHWKEINKTLKEKDICLVYLINLLIEFDRNKVVTTIYEKPSYSYLSNFLDLDLDLGVRLKENNYYNNMDIEELVNNYYILNDREISYNNDILFNYFVKDPDGYVNLRENNNSQSKILQKLKNNESLQILNKNGNWWFVKTMEGIKGYIFHDRIFKIGE